MKKIVLKYAYEFIEHHFHEFEFYLPNSVILQYQYRELSKHGPAAGCIPVHLWGTWDESNYNMDDIPDLRRLSEEEFFQFQCVTDIKVDLNLVLVIQKEFSQNQLLKAFTSYGENYETLVL